MILDTVAYKTGKFWNQEQKVSEHTAEEIGGILSKNDILGGMNVLTTHSASSLDIIIIMQQIFNKWTSY